MGREATLYLLERGVRVTGTDGWSWDAPFVHTREKYVATRRCGLIWEGHKAGREIGYCHLEKLHNLEALPPTGFTVCCFPVKIRGALRRLDARGGDPRLSDPRRDAAGRHRKIAHSRAIRGCHPAASVPSIASTKTGA